LRPVAAIIRGFLHIIAAAHAPVANKSENGDRLMLFILYYVVAITVLVLHFTGVLARYNLEWLVLVLAVTVFPAVIYL
jgi:hypothetical protein